MKRAISTAGLLAVVMCVFATPQPRVTRAMLEAMEKSFDQRIVKLIVDDPIDLLGTTRGIYLEGYGAVFTAEVSLAITPRISPFRINVTKEEIEKIGEKKRRRLPVLKKAMREMLVASAASLDTLPDEEQIVVGMTLLYYSWENRSGLPSQVVMQAQKKVLLDYQAKSIKPEALEASIRVLEQ